MSIGIGINVKNSREAGELYREAFGLELGYHMLNKDGSYFHSEWMKNGEELLSVVEEKEGGPVHKGNYVQLGFCFGTREELEFAFNLLKAGGVVDMAPCELPWSPCGANVTDRFGIHWYLTLPQHYPSADFTPPDC